MPPDGYSRDQANYSDSNRDTATDDTVPNGDSSSTTDGGASNQGKGSSTRRKGSSESGTIWRCRKDAQGYKSCVSSPRCEASAHASECGACVADDEPGHCVPPTDGGCWVTGGGFIVAPSTPPVAQADGHGNFGGNAKPMKTGRVQGHWSHVDEGTGNHVKGKPAYIVCRQVEGSGPGQPGGKKGLRANQVNFGGPAEWCTADSGEWSNGYWFDVVAIDRGEPGGHPSAKNGNTVDSYHFTLRRKDDADAKASGTVVYDVHAGLTGETSRFTRPMPATRTPPWPFQVGCVSNPEPKPTSVSRVGASACT